MTRRKLAELWIAYDDAGHLALDLAAKRRVVALPQKETLTFCAAPLAESERARELLDLLRQLIRDRIESDAAAGHDVRRPARAAEAKEGERHG